MTLLELLFGPVREPYRPGRPRPAVTRGGATRIAPSPRFAWDEKRWRRVIQGNAVSYVGRYRVWDPMLRAWRRFDGRLIEADGEIKAYVCDPPAEIREHAKGPCFQLVNPPWFRVHWHRAPGSVDAALLYVERLLAECLS